MSEPAPIPVSRAPTLAELIYVELVGRAFLRVENNAVIKPEPSQLAKLSIALATEFEKAAIEHRALSGPKNVGYDVQNLDLGSLGA
jgi:hypothetical protein